MTNGADIALDVELTDYSASRTTHVKCLSDANVFAKAKAAVANFFSTPVFAPVLA